MPEDKLIHKKMLAIFKAIEPIAKKHKMEKQGWMFRGIDDMYNTLNKIFADNGVYMLPKVLDSHFETIDKGSDKFYFFRFYTVEYTFYAPDGSNVTLSVAGEGGDYGDKGTGKAMSNAHKYALIQAFLIPTEDNKDSDEAGAETNKEQDTLRQRVVEYIGKSTWPPAKKEAVLKGLPSHSDEYLKGILDGKQGK